MVLIFSIDGDQSTNDVIDWLHYKEVSFMRLNSDDVYFAGSFPSIYLNNRIEKNGESTILKKVKSIWFRRGLQLSGGKGSSYMELGDNIRRIVINKGINNEYKALSSFYFDTFPEKMWLTFPNKSKVNKLNVLYIATILGLDIPETLVSNNKEEVLAFKKKHGRIITKAIYEMCQLTYNSMIYTNGTIEIDENALDSPFAVTLFQELLDKEFEIRVFYLNGKCYCMAIFSQLDPQTQLDFRNYNRNKPNRNIPFKLDKEIEDKVILLMNKLNLNTGSIDFVKVKDGRLVFLEVNPIGQFGMVSIPCNYYIEELIANELINLQNENS